MAVLGNFLGLTHLSRMPLSQYKAIGGASGHTEACNTAPTVEEAPRHIPCHGRGIGNFHHWLGRLGASTPRDRR